MAEDWSDQVTMYSGARIQVVDGTDASSERKDGHVSRCASAGGRGCEVAGRVREFHAYSAGYETERGHGGISGNGGADDRACLLTRCHCLTPSDQHTGLAPFLGRPLPGSARLCPQ